MNPCNQELYRTYELESNQLSKNKYSHSNLEETKNILYNTSLDERLSNSNLNSPPIVLCEANNSRNNKYHRHRYLFYPSASRLFPYNGKDNNLNLIKNAINNSEMENQDKNEKSPEKYQTMYDKSFELVKRISELVPQEDIKIKGNSEYYLNKDQDYMNIIDKEIDTLTNHFKNNNLNYGYNSDGNLNKNFNNLNNENDIDNKNMTHEQYKNNLLQKIKDSKNENYNDQNEERPYNDINNINNSNRNYINDYLKSKDNKNIENIENIEINQPEIKQENINLIKNKNKNNAENNMNNMNKNTIKEKEEEQINNNINNNNKIPQYNTLGMIQNNINNKNNQDNNIKNNISSQKSKTPYILIDENNNKILSSDNKPFQGELISNQYQVGNQIFIRTKSGSDIKLDILRAKEGEPLCYNGFPLMGKGNKFFYDKDGNVIVYPDNEFIKGDKAINVKIFDNKNVKNFGINKNNFEIGEGTGYSMGSTGELKKNKMKNKWYMFPKGFGGAKAPLIKKKKKKK